MSDFNLQNLVRANVQALKTYSSARDEYQANGDKMVFLDANENPFENGLNRYPDPQQRDLKAVLAKLKNVKQEQILLGNGSDEVLDLLFRAFCEPGIDKVITLPPTYGMYKVLAQINNIENREVLLTEEFQLDVKSILKSADKQTKLLFICSPNNPTGNAFDAREIKAILENFRGIVVIDEAYIDFSSYESWIGFLDLYPNLIVTQTLSKAYGMAGIRLGVCYASSAIISILTKIKPPYNVNQLTQQKALERVLAVDEVFDEVEMILKERIQLIKALEEISFIQEIYPTDANFVLVKVDDANKRYQELIEKGIVIRNRTTQPLCENTLRFTIGTFEENKKLVENLRIIDKEI
ncbi:MULTISPECIES: histidinol-phosphate transaminase [Mesonia]|uniref:Histidinol-phosphate aminotransferase n=1 Tax=Mesonia oceanica TaxID=2687242 RepID=A0AC61YD28_9FLAO|nr:MULTISPECIES: histidinol-phosphate transaminase [Mesonia]MAN27137.1 histidinol-phosphate transaminase [Mesonia sp.]MAQ42022.1 histidinol-phosphate transaminase [Mesonia sp.]MBJ97621.1 histidinol-phosphate transaminase [Flavobacteriaceae bacterium]VVV02125.1 Histidinol-phosphate aminotransferase [Mesonia oceanica]|tara:strand:- start:60670 stop:61725 length:1056 start_codon:yes stop_codon:yes gene_type:complete